MKKILKWFKSAKDRRVVEAINIENISTTNRVTLIIFIVELITLLVYIAFNHGNDDFWYTFRNVSMCIGTCLITVIVTNYMQKYYQMKKYISNFWAQFVVLILYLLLSIWGIIVDAGHYANGEQMLTYYIVQFCFFCFLVMIPILGTIMIFVSFGGFFIVLYCIDGAEKIQPLNLILFIVITIIVNAIQYTKLRENQLDKLRIIDYNELLKHEIKIDDLTGLKNRHALKHDMEQSLNTKKILIMLDIDYFKTINDTYGHLVGDEALKKVADALKESFGSENVYRYGGDEFLIFVEDDENSGFEEKIAAWKNALSLVQLKEIDKKITCSYGYASGLYSNVNEFMELIQSADEKLYEAKKQRKTTRSL